MVFLSFSLSLSLFPLSFDLLLLRSASELSYITFVEERRKEKGVRWNHQTPPKTWKQPPHLVCIIGTQIFETSFFIFQTIDCLIYELALEFHCTKATDEKITANEIFVRREREREWMHLHVLLVIPSFQGWICFVQTGTLQRTEWDLGFRHLKSPFSVILNFTLCF